ncbi:MAG: STAS domain-containing protein [Burkholderiales bacterium]|nr:STAS domain-containing protein [Burkholderiales bacterium]
MQLPAKATLEQAAALAATLPAAVADGSGVLRIDASPLQSYDSSTIALLLQARRLAQAAGRGFQVDGAPWQLAELARLYGVEELLSLASVPTSEGPRERTVSA